MDHKALIESLSSTTVSQFKVALELGKWPDGRRLGEEQKSACLQAIIYWECRHLPEEQRTGFIHRGPKEDGDRCSDPQVLHLQND